MLYINDGTITAGKKPAIKVTVMPGKHVPPGPLSVANDLSKAVPPTNGWMVELGYSSAGNDESLENGYRIYISGDTLMVNELKEIPELNKGQHIDLMLMHLGGTTIPSPSVPLLMVTMDAKQRIELVQLIQPDVTILIHYERAAASGNMLIRALIVLLVITTSSYRHSRTLRRRLRRCVCSKVVYLDRKDQYKFKVNQ